MSKVQASWGFSLQQTYVASGAAALRRLWHYWLFLCCAGRQGGPVMRQALQAR